ncbi:MAG: single-stranded DNA-binding protein [Clostridia bacterium]|nr:single-stranded DNA-binding protein [Clostridia bacterium]
MNKFQFMGRLTKDPETRYTPNTNTQVTTFSIAVNRRFTAQGNERQADFFNLVAYGKLAEFCSRYYKKGQQVLVEGRIQNRSWDDQNGTKRYATDFIVENAYFADSRRDSSNSSDMDIPTSSIDGEFITVDDTEELPF